MKGWKKILTVFIILILSCTFFIPLSVEAEDHTPGWQEGDSWAMGYEQDIEEGLMPGFDLVEDEIEELLSQGGDVQGIHFDFDGSFSSYQYIEVVEEEDEHYIVEIHSQTELSMEGEFEITGHFPENGTSIIDFDPNIEEKTISGEGSFDFNLISIVEVEYTKPDLEISDIVMDLELSIEGNLDLENFPDIEMLKNEWVIEYTDYEIGLSISFDLFSEVSFDEPIDVFQFPIEQDTSWDVSSVMTVNGSYEAVFDISGLPEDILLEFITEFDLEIPWVCEDIEFDDKDWIENGEIEIIDEPIEIHISCIGKESIGLNDEETTEVYILTLNIPDEAFQEDEYDIDEMGYMIKYSPEEGNIIATEISIIGTSLNDYIGEESIEMEPVEINRARRQIDSLEEDVEDDSVPYISIPMVLISVLGATVIANIILKKERR